jgi:dihydroflavonol-4-reductase
VTSPPVLITGGTGFVGGALLQRLLADGRDVRALARSEAAAATLAARGASPVAGDLDDGRSLRAAMEGVTTVFHCAGVNAMCLRDPSELYRVNVGGSERVLRAAADARVGRVVYTSSAATIGEAEGVVGHEDSPHRGTFLSEYERSKYLAEERMRAVAGELGVEVVTVNPSSVQGPGRTGGSARLLLGLVNARLPVVVSTFLSIVDVEDCAEGHLLAERAGVPGDRYLLNGATLSVAEAIDLLRRVSGRPRRVLTLPRASARAGGRLAGAVARLTGGPLPACPEMVRTLLHGHRFDGSRAERELGLTYHAIEDTVTRTIAWYADRGLLRRP